MDTQRARDAFNDPDKEAAWEQFIVTIPKSYRAHMRAAFDAGWTAGVIAGLGAREA